MQKTVEMMERASRGFMIGCGDCCNINIITTNEIVHVAGENQTRMQKWMAGNIYMNEKISIEGFVLKESLLLLAGRGSEGKTVDFAAGHQWVRSVDVLLFLAAKQFEVVVLNVAENLTGTLAVEQLQSNT